MRKSALVCLVMWLAPPAFGQLESNSITVSVSRSATVQPDQVVFAVTVQSGLSTSLDDVVAALQGSGITAANLAGVNSINPLLYVQPAPPPLSWTFTLTEPFSKQKDTVTSLTALQQTIAQAKSGLTLSFTIAGTQVSAQALQSQTCSLSGLISDATSQAQSIAAAAGVTVGPILALSTSTASPIPAAVNFISGAFSSVYVAPSPYAPPCGLTVKFGLLRF
jgi:uncharacterized protein YggE